MALKIKEFDVNYITAVKGKSVNSKTLNIKMLISFQGLSFMEE